MAARRQTRSLNAVKERQDWCRDSCRSILFVSKVIFLIRRSSRFVSKKKWLSGSYDRAVSGWELASSDLQRFYDSIGLLQCALACFQFFMDSNKCVMVISLVANPLDALRAKVKNFAFS